MKFHRSYLKILHLKLRLIGNQILHIQRHITRDFVSKEHSLQKIFERKKY